MWWLIYSKSSSRHVFGESHLPALSCESLLAVLMRSALLAMVFPCVDACEVCGVWSCLHPPSPLSNAMRLSWSGRVASALLALCRRCLCTRWLGTLGRSLLISCPPFSLSERFGRLEWLVSVSSFPCLDSCRLHALFGVVRISSRATWLILPVVICLSQRLSHACLSISDYTVKLRMAH